MTDTGDAEAVIEAVGDPLVRDDLITDRALTANDPDRLNHGPIAERVLDLVTVSDPPINVALFGAWGSGKSSFSALLARGIEKRGLDIRIVNYNAWTFTGESLQRNFISHTAKALDVDPKTKEGRLYYQGLYEHRRSSGLALSKVDLASLIGLTLVVLVAIIGVISGIVAIAAALSQQDPVKAIQGTIPSVLASSAVTALLVSGVKQILDGARIESDQGAPTQEQLHETFLDLIKDQTKPLPLASSRRRILFFIDELDRCPSGQVVETLAAIRNYFEAPGCLFVVAADRQVLERAFESLPYPNPGSAQNPYYGSASEFFDKIFQYQIQLPPLRGTTLQSFAHELVATKPTGVRASLRAGNGGHLLGQVLYALIPSHVRSPRRVKVLLNAFATNARVSSSRGVEWLPRAQEIAKLTALQTEFPLFANDLLTEPHLPSYLLNPGTAPEARDDLLEKHRLEPRAEVSQPPMAAVAPTPGVTPVVPPVAAAAPALVAGGVNPTDPTPRATADQADTISVAQRRLLRAYLVRVSDVPDAGRDLLYLSSAGQAVDLQDPELAALIEERAIDEPAAVVSAAATRTVEVRQRAIRLLAGQILQGFGLERTNLVAALLGIAEGLQFELGPAVDEATNALTVVDKQDGLDEGDLVPALVVALGASETTGTPFIERLLADARLLADPRRLTAVAALADRLPEGSSAPVWDRIAEVLPTDHTVLDAPLRRLPLAIAIEAVEATGDAIRLEASAAAADPAEAPDLVESLLVAAESREDGIELAGAILAELMANDVTPVYAVLKARAPAVVQGLAVAPQAEDIALAILTAAPAEDWALWTSLLPSVPEDAEASAFATSAITSVFTRTEGVETMDLDEIVMPMLPGLKRLEVTSLWKKLEPALTTAIAARPWATGVQVIQVKVYRAALALLPLGDPVSSGVESLVAANLVLGLETAVAPLGAAAIIGIVRSLPVGAIETVTPVLTAAVVPAASEPLKVRAQIGLAGAMARAGRSDAVGGLLPARDAVFAALTDPNVLRPWTRVPPPPDDVRWMAAQLATAAGASSVPKANIAVFGEWAGASATSEERTGLLLDLLALTDDVSDWIEVVALHGIDEQALATEVSARILAEPKGSRRSELARNLITLQPTTPRAQQVVADLMLSLLARKSQTDFDTAGRLVHATGQKHRSRTRLSEAFQEGVEAGLNLPPGRARELRDSGIVTKRKSGWLDRFLGKK